MGLRWILPSLWLLLLGGPACLKTQEHPSCPGPRELEASKVVLLPSCPGAPGSPGEKGAPGPQGHGVGLRASLPLRFQGNLDHQARWAPRVSQEIQRTCFGARKVFQRRQDGSVDFFRPWSSYKAGFGNQESEFWLGNENLHQLTLQGTWELRVELEDFNGNRTFAHYATFRLLGEVDHYQLVLGKFSEGTAGDSLSFHSGRPFTTYDADHDSSGSNCAVIVHGAWWYASCYR
ncbi:ficolin-3 isoform X4 [Macaca mulatta]